MKILVIGGMHGNEPLGPEVVKLFEEKPVKGVDILLANKEAFRKNCRFVKKDLNRSFPGEIKSTDYETKRAAEILKKTKGYDLVLDFHNTHCPENDCTFIGESANENLSLVSWTFGLKRVIVADYDCINKFAANCISVEISLSSKLNNAKKWYQKINKLSKVSKLPVGFRVEKYKFVYRITLDDRDRFNLPRKKIIAFKPLSKKLADALGVDSPAYPIFIGDGYTPYNYGGLLSKLD